MTGRAKKRGEGRSSQPHNLPSARRLVPAIRGRRSPSRIGAAPQRPRKRVRFVDIESSSSEEPESSSDSYQRRRPRYADGESSSSEESESSSDSYQQRRPHKRPRYTDSESSSSEESESSSDSYRRRQPRRRVRSVDRERSSSEESESSSDYHRQRQKRSRSQSRSHRYSPANIAQGPRKSRVSPRTGRILPTASTMSQPSQHSVQSSGVICANCNKLGHALRDCVTNWSPAGDIPGCYRCNNMSHTIDDCLVQPPYDDATKYQIEVVNRAGRPPLRSIRGWNQLAVVMNHWGL